jgi:hypothetical protein
MEVVENYRRFGIDLNILGYEPSALFEAYYINKCVSFCGRLPMYNSYRVRSVTDSYFCSFIRDNKILFTDTHRWGNATVEAGFKSGAKYDRRQPFLSTEDRGILKLACQWAIRHFHTCSNSGEWSLDHAIMKCEKTTSAGYPWNMKYPNKGRMLDEIGYELLQWKWDQFAEADCPPTIWRCSVKQELRSCKKLAEPVPKMRTFTASPSEHSVNAARLCGDFNERFCETQSWSQVGKSMYFRGWHKLFTRLSKHPNGFELDISEYDSTLAAVLLYSIMQIRIAMWHPSVNTDMNRLRMYNIYRDVIHTWVITDTGDVFQKHGGNPSGGSNTTHDNTLALFILLAFCFIKLAKRGQETVSYYDFISQVSAALYGDDNTFTVSDRIVSWFNAKSIAELLNDVWGIVVKSGPGHWDPCELKTLKFLSNGFVLIDGVWLPCPDYDKTMCSLKWGNPKDDVRFSLLRAYALRLTTWGNVKTRHLIVDYIVYLEDNFGQFLVGEYEGLSMLLCMRSEVCISLWLTTN